MGNGLGMTWRGRGIKLGRRAWGGWFIGLVRGLGEGMGQGWLLVGSLGSLARVRAWLLCVSTALRCFCYVWCWVADGGGLAGLGRGASGLVCEPASWGRGVFAPSDLNHHATLVHFLFLLCFWFYLSPFPFPFDSLFTVAGCALEPAYLLPLCLCVVSSVYWFSLPGWGED
jgi:hypothetical protein